MINFRFFDFETYQDFGWEGYFQLLSRYPHFALIDCVIQWDEFPATEIFPMLLISIGNRSLTGFSFRWKWFEIRCDFFTTAPRNLQFYRRNNNETPN